MIRAARRAAALVFVLWSGVSTAGKALETERAQRLDAALSELGESGMSVIVAIGSTRNETRRIEEFGSFRDDGIPAAQTQLDLLSLTKMVTAIAVLSLVEKGRLQLNETLGAIFPGAPPDKAAITVHHLLTHTAGLAGLSGDDYEPLGKPALLDRVFRTPLWEKPGVAYSYSNTGYSLLAAIVEERSGEPYESYLRGLLDPHGIESFGYESVYDAERSARSTRNRPVAPESWGGDRAWWNLRGNGGLLATADDFLRFRRLFASGELLEPRFVERAMTPHVREYEGYDSFYGYGVVIEEDERYGRIYTHNGGGRFFTSMWVEHAATGDVLFTAGTRSEAGNAFRAMEILHGHLYPEGE